MPILMGPLGHWPRDPLDFLWESILLASILAEALAMRSYAATDSGRLSMMSALIGRVRTIRPAVANWRQAVIIGLTDPYHPEAHYMRGPGPKWRQKHAASTRR
jgi:hypothetical protein